MKDKIEDLHDMRVTGGKRAQKNGVIFEDIISGLAELNQYKVIKYKEYKSNFHLYDMEERLIISQPNYVDYFKRNKRGKQDFIIRKRNPKNNIYSFSSNQNDILDICVQCKCQMSSGSVDEKIASFVLNLEHKCIEQKNVIFLYHGSGIRKCFIDKLEELAVSLRKTNDYNLHIMRKDEFDSFLSKL